MIIVILLKKINSATSGFKTGKSKQIYDYLRDHHKGEQTNPVALLISYLKRLEGVKVGSYEAGIKARELASLYKLEELQPLLPAIAEFCKKRPTSIFIDELDRGWDASEDAQAFVSGLVQASIGLNEVSAAFTVYVSLRRELYESIPALYDDAQKYRDIIETVDWDEPQLLRLVANRIRFNVPHLRNSDDSEAWSAVFAETLEYRNARSFNYMIDRTLYRPREIIQFCADALEAWKSEEGSPKINYSVISQSELEYSESRAKDIAAEYRFQYPGLLSVFEVFRGKPYLLYRDDLELTCLQIVLGEVQVDPEASWVLSMDHDQLIEGLWKVGFLRAYAVGGQKARRRSGSAYLGPHQIASLNLRSIPRFHIHPMFRAFLGLKETKGKTEAYDQ